MELALAPGNTAALAVVADGVGGEAGADVASRFVARTVREYIAERGIEVAAGSPVEHLAGAVREAHRLLRQAQKSTPTLSRMASTVVALLVGAESAAVAHVGDSRCYCWRDGSLELLTTDHTVAQQMVEDGTIAPEQAGHALYGNVLTRAVGQGEQLSVGTRGVDVRPGDRFLLCSDGLSGLVSDEELARGMAARSGPGGVVSALMEHGYAAGAPDNITLIALEAGSGDAG
jgi:protein phosphatase